MWTDVWGELIKLKSQRKSYVVLLGHLGILILLYMSVSSTGFTGFARQVGRDVGLRPEEIFDAFYFSRMVMGVTFLMLLPIYICTLAGDMIAGEIQEGGLKLTATRPRSRSRIVLSKAISLGICSIILCIVTSLFTLLCSILLFDVSETQIIILNPNIVGMSFCLMKSDTALFRMLCTCGLYGFSIFALGCITLFYSTLVSRMTTATVLGMTTYFVSYFIEIMPQASSIRPYLLSHVMGGWNYLWLNTPAWDRFLYSQLHLAMYIFVFVGLSLTVFSYRDIR